MELITGYAGEPHIYPADSAAQNKGTITGDNVVLDTDEKFAYELVYNNTIRIKSGTALFQGRIIRIRTNMYDELTIENGTQALIRNDIIVARYTYDDGIESVNLVVVKGTPGESGTDPEIYDSNDIDQGDTVCDMPLYRVVINGLNVESVTPLFTTIQGLQELKRSIDQSIESLNTELKNYWKNIYPVGSIYVSVNAANPGTFWGGTWVAWGSGRVPVGINTGDSNFNAVEKIGGESTHILLVSEMPSHKHQIPAHSHSISGHTHSIPQMSGSTSNTGEHQHEIITEYGAATDPNASPDAEKIMQIAGVNAGTKRWKTGKINAVGNHIHTVTTNASTTGSGGNGNTGNSAVIDTGEMGSTAAHNNLQPYITCYMWKRTA